jgi:hypothetical protein
VEGTLADVDVAVLAEVKNQIIHQHNMLLLEHRRAVTDVMTTYVIAGKMYVVGSTQTRPVPEPPNV